MRWKWLALAAIAGAHQACDGCNGGPGNETDDTGGGAPAGALEVSDDNNYSYVGDIEIQEVEVEAGQDLTFDWCALTTDLRGRPVTDPSAVDELILTQFALSQEEVEAKVEQNDIKQSDAASTWLLLNPGDCTVQASAFEINEIFLDPGEYFLENPNESWLVSVANLPDGRQDILTSKFIVPKDAGTLTTVAITDECATLEVDVDLQSGDTLQVEAGDVPVLDWSGLDYDVNGAVFDFLAGDRLLIGKVDAETIDEVEETFLRLDIEAEELYYANVYSLDFVDLGIARDADGNAFMGFTADGIWLVGIECLQCTSPAPLFLTVVEVIE